MGSPRSAPTSRSRSSSEVRASVAPGMTRSATLQRGVPDATVGCVRMNHVVEHLYRPPRPSPDPGEAAARRPFRLHPESASLGSRIFAGAGTRSTARATLCSTADERPPRAPGRLDFREVSIVQGRRLRSAHRALASRPRARSVPAEAVRTALERTYRRPCRRASRLRRRKRSRQSSGEADHTLIERASAGTPSADSGLRSTRPARTPPRPAAAAIRGGDDPHGRIRRRPVTHADLRSAPDSASRGGRLRPPGHGRLAARDRDDPGRRRVDDGRRPRVCRAGRSRPPPADAQPRRGPTARGGARRVVRGAVRVRRRVRQHPRRRDCARRVALRLHHGPAHVRDPAHLGPAPRHRDGARAVTAGADRRRDRGARDRRQRACSASSSCRSPSLSSCW